MQKTKEQKACLSQNMLNFSAPKVLRTVNDLMSCYISFDTYFAKKFINFEAKTCFLNFLIYSTL